VNNKQIVSLQAAPGLCVRTADQADLHHLRTWKNEQRRYFFHQDLISPEQQQRWFDAFSQRPNDYMFVVEWQGQPIGCMGIRLLEAQWDIYNVILGDPAHGKQGHMGRSFAAMLAMALQVYAAPITLKVLKHNPAVAWYLKNGFTIAFEASDHYGLRYEGPIPKDIPP
jgi:ribosomal protein S18 acetylase RimI-like enzyme